MNENINWKEPSEERCYYLDLEISGTYLGHKRNFPRKLLKIPRTTIRYRKKYVLFLLKVNYRIIFNKNFVRKIITILLLMKRVKT